MRLIVVLIAIFFSCLNAFAFEPLNILGLTPDMKVSDALDKIKKEYPLYHISENKIENDIQELIISSETNDDVIYLVSFNSSREEELVYIQRITRHDDIESFINDSKDNFHKQFGEPKEIQILRDSSRPYTMKWFEDIYRSDIECRWDIEFSTDMSADMNAPNIDCKNILVVGFSSQDRGGKISITQTLVNPTAVADYIAHVKNTTSVINSDYNSHVAQAQNTTQETNIQSSSSQTPTNEELATAMRSVIMAFGRATTLAINCNDRDAIKRISSLRGGVIATFSNAGIFEQADSMMKMIDAEVEGEQSRTGNYCDMESLSINMRRLESDYKYFTDLMDRKR